MLQLFVEVSLLPQILLGAFGSLLVIFLLVRRASQDGSGVSLLAFAIFFLNLFYTVRGIAFLVVGDDELAIRVGVRAPATDLGLAMAWFNGFLGLFCLGAFIERNLRWNRCVLSQTTMNSPTAGLPMGLMVFIAGSLFIGANVLASRFVPVAGFFVIVIPFGFGFCLAGFARWISPQLKPGLLSRIAIGIAIAFAIAYATRGQFTARLYSIGILALLGGFLIAQLKLNVLAMLGLLAILPLIQSVGETRHTAVGSAGLEVVSRTHAKMTQGPLLFVLEPYTADSGDFTALDIFASVLVGEQSYRPWGLSFLYMFVHWVPRNVWPDKPESGILTDESSFRLARVEFSGESIMIPYDPGIVGTLYLEGGVSFVVLGAILLGFTISRWDRCIAETVRVDGSKIFACSLFAMALFVLFFAARFRPYQIFYLVVSLHLGYYLGLRILKRFAPR